MKNFFSIILLKKQFFSYHLKPLLFYKQPLQYSIQKRKSYPNIFNPIQIQSYRAIETSYPFLLKHKVNSYFHSQKIKSSRNGTTRDDSRIFIYRVDDTGSTMQQGDLL